MWRSRAICKGIFLTSDSRGAILGWIVFLGILSNTGRCYYEEIHWCGGYASETELLGLGLLIPFPIGDEGLFSVGFGSIYGPYYGVHFGAGLLLEVNMGVYTNGRRIMFMFGLGAGVGAGAGIGKTYIRAE